MPDMEFDLPEIGEPGTATEAQIEAVERLLRYPLGTPISYQQAQLILDAREYARATIAVLERAGLRVGPNHLPLVTVFILKDQSLRKYVSKWGRARFARGTHDGSAPLRRNEHFQKVFSFAQGLSTGRQTSTGPAQAGRQSTESQQEAGNGWSWFRRLVRWR